MPFALNVQGCLSLCVCETQAILKQNYVEKVNLCDVVPLAVSECKHHCHE